MESSAFGIVVVFLLVVANGFFVATEFAIVGARKSRLEQLAQEGHPSAEAAKHITAHLDTYIAACQLGITMASLALGWVGEPALAGLIEPPLESLVHQFAPAASHGIAVGISFAIITSLHIVIGELAPKGLALQRPEGTALWVAKPMRLFELVFRWPIGLLNGVGNGVLRIAGLHPASGHEMVHSVAELRLLVLGSREAGVVEEAEARIASRAFEFGELTAGDLMTPRTELEGVPVTIGREELLAAATAAAHTRLIVYRDSLDDVVGVVHMRELLKLARQPAGPFDIRALVRPVAVTPETKHAHELLEEFRITRRHAAVVVDEYGGTAGLVTIEDLVEPLVGRIESEPQIGDLSTAAADAPERATDGSLLLDGLTRLDEFEEISGLEVSEELAEEVSTLGGLIMTVLERVPRVGDEIWISGRKLRVEELDGLRVARVRLLP